MKKDIFVFVSRYDEKPPYVFYLFYDFVIITSEPFSKPKMTVIAQSNFCICCIIRIVETRGLVLEIIILFGYFADIFRYKSFLLLKL
jgi:hypothetical protein